LLRKFTVPAGVPELPLTRTVSVTAWPAAREYDDASRPRLGDAVPPVPGGGGVGVDGGGVGVEGGGVGVEGGGAAVPPEVAVDAAMPNFIAELPASAAPT
jgi:hypothetical protein